MNLYEIKEEYLRALESIEVDEETGEILNLEMIEKIESEFNAKVENVACYIKNLIAYQNAIDIEIKLFQERTKKLDTKIEKLKSYLTNTLQSVGKNEYKSARVELSFKKSTITEIFDGFVEWAKKNAKDLLNYKEPTADKTKVKNAIKNNQAIKFAQLTEKQNLQIK